jgi:hypothetical protein
MANELIIKNGLIVDSGGIQVTGSVTLGDVLQLPVRTTTPTGTSGMLIVSGSGATEHIYCYLDGIWKQLDN